MELKNQFMTPAELAGYLKITRKTIYRLIKRKKLLAYLKKTSEKRYSEIIKKIGLKK